MALNFGYTDSIATPKSLQIPDLAYATDFAIAESGAGRVVLVNITSPTSREERIRYELYDVTNAYKGTGIPVEAQPVIRSGRKLVANIQETWMVSPDEATQPSTPTFLLPVSATLTLTFPNIGSVTPDALGTLLTRLVATFYSTGKADNSQLSQMMKGALMPTVK